MVYSKKFIQTIFTFSLISGLLFCQIFGVESGIREVKLVFQEMKNNDVIFYDEVKKIYYLVYRRDKWDYANDLNVQKLVSGVQYYVTIEEINNSESSNRNNQDPKVKIIKNIRRSESIVKGRYIKHRTGALDSLRY